MFFRSAVRIQMIELLILIHLKNEENQMQSGLLQIWGLFPNAFVSDLTDNKISDAAPGIRHPRLINVNFKRNELVSGTAFLHEYFLFFEVRPA
jgi:hypothetical protein